MKYHLWRILGNDLPPRHPDSQTETNLKFILGTESLFEDCEKRFLINRVYDDDKRRRLVDAIQANSFHVDVIPFEEDVFDSLGSYQEKAHYLTNVNSARNYCVKQSLAAGADVVCPMDGGMFFRDDGWTRFAIVCSENLDDGFFSFATWRVESIEDMLNMQTFPTLYSTYKFGKISTVGLTEFQLAFTQHSDCLFDESLPYGREDKVELLYRLGIPGLWDHWNPKLYKDAEAIKSKFSGKVNNASFVCRLPSGNIAGDKDNELRGQQRKQGLQSLIDKISTQRSI